MASLLTLNVVSFLILSTLLISIFVLLENLIDSVVTFGTIRV